MNRFNEVWKWTQLAAALLLLNASLTFQNVWPTPAIRLGYNLSIEFALCIIGLAAFAFFGNFSSRAVQWLAVIWVVLIIGHYLDVTAPGLYGRPINLFWDVRHLAAVGAMLFDAATLPAVMGVVIALLLLLLLLYFVMRWALGRVSHAMNGPRPRLVLAGFAAAAFLLWSGQQLAMLPPAVPPFSNPVATTYLRQARLLAHSITPGGVVLEGSGPIESDLTNVKGADVLMVFMESYGAVSYDRPEFASALAEDRRQFEADVKEAGRELVSAYVESPTFGGSSWLAHVSLMSGVEARDEDTNALLMSQKRDTVVTLFARHGYRTIALMPGLRQVWPEGAFYGFDKIYGFDELAYRGPRFGWWTIPDQFSLARLDEMEMTAEDSRSPVFAFFPTGSSHTPFGPMPPYQPDWQRLLSKDPFDAADVELSLKAQPDLMNLGPGYVRALKYAYASFGGYIKTNAQRDFVLILIGDHQPPAAVSGEGAPWNVPVHIVSNRRHVIESLLAQGFRHGITPELPALGPMHRLLPKLLSAFGTKMVSGL